MKGITVVIMTMARQGFCYKMNVSLLIVQKSTFDQLLKKQQVYSFKRQKNQSGHIMIVRVYSGKA